MNASRARWTAIVLVLGLFTALSSGCVVPGDGYGYDTRVGIGVGYYEPYGSYYGGWGSGYYVGPTHGNYNRYGTGGHAYQHAYRPAPGVSPVPSIPARRRGDNRQQSNDRHGN